jgi:serine protease Do
MVALAAVVLPHQAYPQPVLIEAAAVPDFSDVFAAVSPAVVSVKVDREFPASQMRRFRFDRRFSEGEDFFEGRPGQRDRNQEYDIEDGRARPFARKDGFPGRGEWLSPPPGEGGHGSGFIVSEEGHVVTSHHIVANGSKFAVVMADGVQHDATLVGADARSDIAVLKIVSEEKFTHVRFSADPVKVGQWTVAVGNPFGRGATMTAGIVSGHNRDLPHNRSDEFLQIDAAANRGNSGGPAFNLKGEVIGVTNAIFQPGGFGVTFAIPASVARGIVDDLIANGRVVRGWLGVQIQPVTDEIAASLGLEKAQGVIVTEPLPGSPAAKAGIVAGDIIQMLNSEKVTDPRDLALRIAKLKPDEKIAVGIWRNGASSVVEVIIGKLEDNSPASLEARDKERGFARFGLSLQPLDGGGLAVSGVEPGSRASARGLAEGDVVMAVNGEQVGAVEELIAKVRGAIESGRNSVLLQVRRGSQTLFIALPVDRN